LRNFAFVERLSAVLSDLFERPCQFGIAKYFADFRRAIAGQVGLRRRFVVPPPLL